MSTGVQSSPVETLTNAFIVFFNGHKNKHLDALKLSWPKIQQDSYNGKKQANESLTDQIPLASFPGSESKTATESGLT